MTTRISNPTLLPRAVRERSDFMMFTGQAAAKHSKKHISNTSVSEAPNNVNKIDHFSSYETPLANGQTLSHETLVANG